MLSEWPVERPADWAAWVNTPETAAELEALRRSCRRGRPYGGEEWAQRTADGLGVESSLRPVGRPPKRKPQPGAGYAIGSGPFFRSPR